MGGEGLARERSPELFPSILNADFFCLERFFDRLSGTPVRWLHLDVMDGHFVPNLSFGMPVIESLTRHVSLWLDVHLMVELPERYIPALHKLGVRAISVHVEACPHLHRVLAMIRSGGEGGRRVYAGVALNPHTPVEVLRDVLDEVDYVLLMAVNPGFGGQTFQSRVFRKIRRLFQMCGEEGLEPPVVQVDGGVTLDRIEALLDAGFSWFVMGSALTGAEFPERVVEAFYRRVEEWRARSLLSGEGRVH